MANRYFIRSLNDGPGPWSWNNAANWSDTDGGAGGASVPGEYDDRFFNVPTNISEVPTAQAGTFTVNASDVTWNFSGNIGTRGDITIKSGAKFVILGGLLTINGTARVVIEESAALERSSSNWSIVFNYDSVFWNNGFFNGTAIPRNNDYVVHRIGRCRAIALQSGVSDQGGAAFSGLGALGDMDLYDGLLFFFYANQLAGTYDLLSPVKVGRIQFSLAGTPVLTFNQKAAIDITGNVASAGNNIDNPSHSWALADGVRNVFSGTADQTIGMPSWAAGQRWIVDKPAGTLDLQAFDGFLQGRARTLIVRSGSKIDLSGTPPLLAGSASDWSAYDGLKADSTSADRNHAETTGTDHDREALDLVDNYGLITIPTGKVLCAKMIRNFTGARITGEGTLCVRYGKLIDAGTIDAGVRLKWFDRPVSAVLSALPSAYSNTEYSVDLAGSIGSDFVLDWGDGTFSKASRAGVLKHVYPRTDVAVTRTVRLTATNDEGLVDQATAMVEIRPQPVSVELDLTPSSGPMPLTVTASVRSDYGRYFTFSWGDGQTTGPTEAAEATYTYFEQGNYSVTVTAVNLEGASVSTSVPLVVLPPPPPPQARLSVVPWQGNLPLNATLSTEGSVGSRMSVDWGDGTPVLGPMNWIENVLHDYMQAGRYLVRLTVWNEANVRTEATQVVAVSDPEQVRAELDLRPSSGYAPLTVLADASLSAGERFSYDWGDGSSDGPSEETSRIHTYTVPGYYRVVLTVSKNGQSASTVGGVVVLLSPLIPTDPVLPSRLGPVEIEGRKKASGVPRGNMPYPYRYSLAQGVEFMHDTLQLFCPMRENGRALANGSSLFLGRIAHADGRPVSPTEIESASYTIFRLDNTDPSFRRPVEGHADIALNVPEILLPDLIQDENWPFDESGYNFRHTLDDSVCSPFPEAGRNYLAAFELRPQDGRPRIQLQYRVRVI